MTAPLAACDFCFAPNPTYAHGIGAFELHDYGVPDELNVYAFSARNLAACSTCSGLIRSRSWAALTTRATGAVIRVHPPTDPSLNVLDSVAHTIGRMVPHLTGEVREIPAEAA